uniref:C2H2-type domain-containing protein n=1 Tax=Anopheles dirus TaxID=7168 RepID=A0A182NCA7_9DIPT
MNFFIPNEVKREGIYLQHQLGPPLIHQQHHQLPQQSQHQLLGFPHPGMILPEGFIVKVKEEYTENYVRTVTKIPEVWWNQEQFIRTVKSPGKKERKYHDYNAVSEHQCDVCGKYFKDKYKLNYHVRIHVPELSHRCDVCGKVFAHQSTLHNHKRIHTACANYSDLNELTEHYASHHTAELTYRCQACGKSFAQANHLKIHKKNFCNSKSSN